MNRWKGALVRALLTWSGRRHLIPFLEGLFHLGRPSKVAFPPELLEQGAILALSGIGNTAAIQSQPDWLWPLWVLRQTNPDSPEFVPTGLNLLTTNLTGRNWTSIGVAGSEQEAMVDPSGVLTQGPFSWSVLPFLDWAFVGHDAETRHRWIPPQCPELLEQVSLPGTWGAIRTRWKEDAEVSWEWEWEAVELDGEKGILFTQRCENRSAQNIALRHGLSLRPWNPLTLGHINRITYADRLWRVNGSPALLLDTVPQVIKVSDRHHGDPLLLDSQGLSARFLRSRTGIATGLHWTESVLESGDRHVSQAWVPLPGTQLKGSDYRRIGSQTFAHGRERMRMQWRSEQRKGTQFRVPDTRLQNAVDAVRSRLHVFDDGKCFTPGTFLYHEHWFRDSFFIALAYENMGLGARVVEKLLEMPKKQDREGFLVSQTGEWDSNGQALHSIATHLRRGGDPQILSKLWPMIRKAVAWIHKVRSSTIEPHSPHRGLMPAGFSAEHFGPNDHYFWDNFWSVAGLRDAIWMANVVGATQDAQLWQSHYEEASHDLEAAIQWSRDRCGGGLPSSPYRGMDSACVGNLVAIQPLGLVDPFAPWVEPTLEHIMDRHMRQGMFFQSIVHTGLNPYLTVQVARVLLVRGDARLWSLIEGLLDHATSTWCWPEAIHPRTGGGCMGDGDHGWAAGEFLSLVREVMVQDSASGLLLAAGVPWKWMQSPDGFGVQSAPTHWGLLTYHVSLEEERTHIHWNCDVWDESKIPRIQISLPCPNGARIIKELSGQSGEIWYTTQEVQEEGSHESRV